MKTLAFLAALSLGTVAIAQNTGTAPANSPPGGQAMSPPSDSMAPGTPPNAGDTSMSAPPTGTIPTDNSMAPGAMSPDASGDASMTSPSAGTAPTDSSTPPTAGTPMASGSTSDYPTCSRTVKDRCKNRGGK